MILGLVVIGSVVGTLSAVTALLVGQSLATATLVYFASAAAAVFTVMSLCAGKHALQYLRRQQDASALRTER